MFGKETPAQYQARKDEKARKQAEYQARQRIKSIMSEAHDLRTNQNYQSAITKFSDVLREQSNHKGAFYFRGQCKAKLKQYQSALQDYQNAERITDPWFKNDDMLRNDIGVVYARIGDERYAEKRFNECVSLYQEAIARLSNKDQVGFCHYYCGVSNKSLNQLQLSLTHLKEAVRYHPKRVDFSMATSHCFKLILIRATSDIERKRIISQYQSFIREMNSSLPEEEWLRDDERWVTLLEKFKNGNIRHELIVREPGLHFGDGKFAFNRTVLNWDLNDIQRVDALTPLQRSYGDTKQYYQAMLPLILEEAKAAMRQYLELPVETFELKVEARNYSKNSGNPCNIITKRLPNKYLESSQSCIVLWINGNLKNGKKASCLGLASVDDKNTRIKLMLDNDTLKLLKNFEASYLGSLVTYERMYSVCYEEPGSHIVQQISSTNLSRWPQSHLNLTARTSHALDTSQKQAIKGFLSSSDNSLTLLQGPPGTGKTTTIIALLQECKQRNLRVLVSAPSNKAIQEIATRLLQQSPEIKMMLAGVEKKVPDELLPIFLHGWHTYFLSQVSDIVKNFISTNKLLKLLTASNEERNKIFNSFFYRFDNAAMQVIKYYPELTPVLNSLKKQMLLCRKNLFTLSDLELEQWPETLRDANNTNLNAKYTQHTKNVRGIQTQYEALAKKLTNTVQEEFVLLENADIVFASLSVCGRGLFQRLQRSFDVTVIDEAGQALPAETLIPLRLPTNKALFVGDPQQLPATTFSDASTKTNFAKSTLSALIDSGVAHHMLTYQYRMHPEIRLFPSNTFYQGLLQDGNNIQDRENPLSRLSDIPFIPYGFVNINSGKESRNKNSFYNETECSAINKLIDKINKVDTAIQIGVIAFYRAQVDKLQQRLKPYSNVLVSTVDGFQGGECDCILISCVRANSGGNIGFAKDFRRINVAITRARFGLVIFGHAKTLQKGDHTLAQIIDDAVQRKKYFDDKSLLSDNPEKCKTQHCRFFAEGNCERGNNCTFKHDTVENQKTNKSRQFST